MVYPCGDEARQQQADAITAGNEQEEASRLTMGKPQVAFHNHKEGGQDYPGQKVQEECPRQQQQGE
ncbi:MAG TPA: hypothetical protein DCE18_06815 [Syntrophobacteraceae bacterium]|nr:hypothetical protein [Syntrophobacteraceae bacterium]